MKRWSLRILKYLSVLLLALIANYAVAWLAIMYADLKDVPDKDGSYAHVSSPINREEVYGPYEGRLHHHKGVAIYGVYVQMFNRTHELGGMHQDGKLITDMWWAGWPMYAVKSRVILSDWENNYQSLYRWELPLSIIIERGMQTNDLPVFLNAAIYRRLPLMPYFPGFAVNLAFYFVLIYLMLHSHKIVQAIVLRFTAARNS